MGAALVEGGVHAVNWGGLDGWHPVGVVGTLVALAISPLLGALAALLVIRGAPPRSRAAARGAGTRRSARGEWGMSAALAFSHGANDAQKSIGVIAALLLAAGRIDTLGGAAVGEARVCRRRSPWARRSAGGGSSAPWAAASTGSSPSTGWPARPRRRA